MGAGRARSRERVWKVLRGLRLRCNGSRFGELGDDAELLHKAQSVPVDIAFPVSAELQIEVYLHRECAEAWSKDFNIPLSTEGTVAK